MKDALLEVKGLKKYFPIYAGLFRREIGQVKAVDGIDFAVPRGGVLGLVGESGSGKSTAARAAIRLIDPTAGSITFDGESFLQLNAEQLKAKRKDIQIVFQDPYASLNPRKTVGQSIGEALSYHRLVSSPEEQEERVAAVLKQVGISPDAMQRYPHEFSGGQQQRICIGRAIAPQPKLLVCDEAVSALDVSVQAQILNLLVELKEQFDLSYLFISHDLSVIHYISDYIVVMQRGKIVEQGATEALFRNPRQPYTQALLAAIPPTHPRQKQI